MNPIEKNAASYMQTDEHTGRMSYAETRDKKRLAELFKTDRDLAFSDAMGTMVACCTFFRAVGMKQVAIMILKQALAYSRSGNDA